MVVTAEAITQIRAKFDAYKIPFQEISLHPLSRTDSKVTVSPLIHEGLEKGFIVAMEPRADRSGLAMIFRTNKNGRAEDMQFRALDVESGTNDSDIWSLAPRAEISHINRVNLADSGLEVIGNPDREGENATQEISIDLAVRQLTSRDVSGF